MEDMCPVRFIHKVKSHPGRWLFTFLNGDIKKGNGQTSIPSTYSSCIAEREALCQLLLREIITNPPRRHTAPSPKSR